MTIEVLHPGMLTTVQDEGRFGLRGVGVVTSGAMDRFALQAANLLVGNERGAATLEMTLTGATLVFHDDALVALCGADMDARADEGPPLPGWRPVLVRRGTVLRFGRALRGARACLAVAGGIAVPAVLGSRSTHVPSRLGGFAGRALQPGDRLQAGTPSAAALALVARLAAAAPEAPIAPAAWAIAPSARPPYAEQPAVRVTRGREAEAMTGGSLHSFFTTPYSITPQSDRMGYRLAGARLEEAEPREMISEAVTMGTVQVPPGGQPIVLMADAQTTGGYPRIAQVAAADLPLLAQLKPGETVRFREITLQEAQSLYIRQQLDLRRLEQLVRLKAGASMP
ncbi:biotin-dependent carboxyltransferase family protein [Paenibacillus sp. OAS669]|uniref:5-oxoprolinase subunit C family protein n=1 Tax=Paenibacillus sp. OAS669 TaxID=2663821 RepID=UPI001789DF1C|nr:biotin-dependent carboxyltransferase family protein [Paenibacillus sp. OAS669]MBE1441639.1 antagonist of KipI [Paenibacillus sp. OAS669]